MTKYIYIFLPRSLTLGILFSTVIRATVLTKLVILGISFLNSFILAFREVLVAKLLISSILSSIFLIWALYKSSLTTFVFLDHLVYLNHQEQILMS